MPNITPNLGLKKPLRTEQYDINEVTNDNADVIDAFALDKMTYKGSVEEEIDLPSSDQEVGDLYFVSDVNTHYVWTGSEWRIVGTGTLEASSVQVDTTNFDKNLSSLDDTVQKALETIDDLSGGQYLGTATTKAISYNAQSIAENITIPSTFNALSVGTVTIEDGFTVELEAGAVWVII